MHVKKKNPALAAALGFLFGAFGLMYVSVIQGLVAVVLLLAVGVLTGGRLTPVIWVGCAVWAYFAAVRHNRRHVAMPEELSSAGSPHTSPTASPRFCRGCEQELSPGADVCAACGRIVDAA